MAEQQQQVPIMEPPVPLEDAPEAMEGRIEELDDNRFLSLPEDDKFKFTVPPSSADYCDDNAIDYVQSVLSNETTKRIEHFEFKLDGWNVMDPVAMGILTLIQSHRHIKYVTLDILRYGIDQHPYFDPALLLGCLRAAANNPRLSSSDVTVITGYFRLADFFFAGFFEEFSRLVQGKLVCLDGWDLMDGDDDDNDDDEVARDISRGISNLQSLQKLELDGTETAAFQRQLFVCLEQRKMPNLRELVMSLSFNPQDLRSDALGAFLGSTDACFLDTLVLDLYPYHDHPLLHWVEGLRPNKSIKKIQIRFKPFENRIPIKSAQEMQRLTQIVQTLLSDQVEEFQLYIRFSGPPLAEALRELQTGVWPLLHSCKTTIKSLAICDALFASYHAAELTGAGQLKQYLVTAPGLKNLRIDLKGYRNQGWQRMHPHCQTISEGITRNTTLKNISIRTVSRYIEYQYQGILLQGVFPTSAAPSTAMMELDVLCQSTGDVRDLVSAARDCAALKKLKVASLMIDEETWVSIAGFLPVLNLQTLIVIKRGPFFGDTIRHERVYYELSQGMKRNRSLEEAVFIFANGSNEETGVFVSSIEKICYRNKVWKFSQKLLREEDKNETGGVDDNNSNNAVNDANEAAQVPEHDGKDRSPLKSIKLATTVLRSIDNQRYESSPEKISLQASVVFAALTEHQGLEIARGHVAATYIQRTYLAWQTHRARVVEEQTG